MQDSRGFNPRTPAGCDSSSAGGHTHTLGFNPRTPAGCDLPPLYPPGVHFAFQSTHPCGGATEASLAMDVSSFNPRTPAECDEALWRRLRNWSFNPRTCGACDSKMPDGVRDQLMFQSTHLRATGKPKREMPRHVKVSIHAPAGSTCPSRPVSPPEVYIHARHRGAPRGGPGVHQAHRRFNPRTPAGCDRTLSERDAHYTKFQSTHPCGVRHIEVVALGDDDDVSIHAPLRGATGSAAGGAVTINSVSIHAPLRGATHGAQGHPPRTICFNPRTPAGCDPSIAKGSPLLMGFNPRTPAGCDRLKRRMRISASGFQSTHPCGVRRLPIRLAGGLWRSFNPRTPAGCDYIFAKTAKKPQEFQSTHPCGVRPRFPGAAGARSPVSIHAPLRGATSVSLV